MSPSISQIGIAIALLTTAIALVVWYLQYKVAGSERRMMSMLLHAGLDPDIAFEGDKKIVMEEFRYRCKKCQTEDVCERWLAGELKGGNEFCPNAKIFEILAAKAKRAAWKQLSALTSINFHNNKGA